MAVDEFYYMRPKHFFQKLQEYNRNKESDVKFYSNLARLQTTALINVQLKPGDKIKPHQLWQFPWDEETEVKTRLENLKPEELKAAYSDFISKSKM